MARQESGGASIIIPFFADSPMSVTILPDDHPVPEPGFDSRAFRAALGCFATGVAVVTARTPEGVLLGLTVNSFSSVSLDPPLVLWNLAASSPNLAGFQRASHYAVNVLCRAQENLSNHFATRAEDKFAGIAWTPGLGGAPLLPDVHAAFEVRNEFHYPGGDHLIFVGHVERFTARPEAAPLIFHCGNYRALA
jgi:flavin reductase (DIM6/NTAB) family NADH-FMN oxidoreductase RutF